MMKQANPEEKLKALTEVDSWQRAEVIEKGGWDKMPGQEKAGLCCSPSMRRSASASYQEMRLVRALELRAAF
jgi:hypothetical protein